MKSSDHLVCLTRTHFGSSHTHPHISHGKQYRLQNCAYLNITPAPLHCPRREGLRPVPVQRRAFGLQRSWVKCAGLGTASTEFRVTCFPSPLPCNLLPGLRCAPMFVRERSRVSGEAVDSGCIQGTRFLTHVLCFSTFVVSKPLSNFQIEANLPHTFVRQAQVNPPFRLSAVEQRKNMSPGSETRPAAGEGWITVGSAARVQSDELSPTYPCARARNPSVRILRLQGHKIDQCWFRFHIRRTEWCQVRTAPACSRRANNRGGPSGAWVQHGGSRTSAPEHVVKSGCF